MNLGISSKRYSIYKADVGKMENKIKTSLID